MDFLQNATDDQIALMGCFAALVSSAVLMYISVYLNRSQRKGHHHDSATQTLALTGRDQKAASESVSKRKVA